MKKTIRIVSFAVIFLLLFIGIYKIFSWKDTAGSGVSSLVQMDHLEKNTVDVVFVGSSHVYTGLLPGVLWEEYGISSFDMSISSMDKSSQYYYTKGLLETQSPKVVFLDLYAATFEEHGVLGNEYRNMLSMDYSTDAVKLVKSYTDDEKKQKDYILKWPVIHTRYKELNDYDFVEYDAMEYGLGEYYGFEVADNVNLSSTWCEDYDEISDTNKAWVDAFVELSQEYGFEPVFFLIPYSMTIREQMRMNEVMAYLYELGITCLDCTKIIDDYNLDITTDFSDANHLNVWGAEKFTSWIGKYLANNYELEDHRQDPKYSVWDINYNYYIHRKNMNMVQYSAVNRSDEEFLELITTIPNIYYIVSVDGEWSNTKSYLEVLKIPENEWTDGGIWVGSTGSSTKILDNNSEESYYFELDRYHSFLFQKNLATEGGSLKLGTVNYQRAINGITVVVYDRIGRNVTAHWGHVN